MKQYDIIIVGAGAAGMTAAVYTCRKNLKTAIVSIDIGGQTNLTNHIENYPGTGAMPGPELMQKFKEDAVKFGAEFISGKVTKVEKEKKEFLVTINNKETVKTKAIILAFGRVPRKLNIPGEDKFFGRGVSTCATCDGPLYRNKVVAVIGGGNAGTEGALELSEISTQVYLIHRREELKADPITVEKVKKKKNVEIIFNSIATEIKGDKTVKSIKIKNTTTNKEREIEINGVFIEIGAEVQSEIVKHLVKTNERNEILVDEVGVTSCPGIFAAGDVTQVPFKQTVISAGDGAKAALQCYNYLSGNTAEVQDWKKR
ncbi:thioredoxin-disulfide reductase [Candidatus Woesearchaeota archaeon]|nr:thioredoxin-disulfide reductase [Candidatus Woesearchaeota archaeon]